MNNSSIEQITAGHHYEVINDNVLHYLVSGSGPVCLFPSPGWGPSIDLYTGSMQTFETHFTMVWLDTRGSGLSSGPDDPQHYTSRDFTEDLEALRIHLGLDKMWLMGQSSGAYQILDYATLYNDRLNGIIAISSTAGRDVISAAEFRHNIERMESNPELEPATRLFTGRDNKKRTLLETISKILPLYFHDQEKLALFKTVTGAATYSQKAFDLTHAAKNGSEILFPLLGRIMVPLLLIVGDDDFICDLQSQSERIHQLIPSSTLLVIKNAGHFCWIEQPVAFFAGAGNWLDSHIKKY